MFQMNAIDEVSDYSKDGQIYVTKRICPFCIPELLE